MVSFTVELAQGKTGENFCLYVDPALAVNGYWKEDSTGAWINIASEPYGGKMVMEGGRLRLDFDIEDGGQFDADGKVDHHRPWGAGVHAAVEYRSGTRCGAGILVLTKASVIRSPPTSAGHCSHWENIK